MYVFNLKICRLVASRVEGHRPGNLKVEGRRLGNSKVEDRRLGNSKVEGRRLSDHGARSLEEAQGQSLEGPQGRRVVVLQTQGVDK